MKSIYNESFSSPASFSSSASFSLDKLFSVSSTSSSSSLFSLFYLSPKSMSPKTTSSNDIPALLAARKIEDKEQLYLKQTEHVSYEGERIFSLGKCTFQKEQRIAKLVANTVSLFPSIQSFPSSSRTSYLRVFPKFP